MLELLLSKLRHTLIVSARYSSPLFSITLSQTLLFYLFLYFSSVSMSSSVMDGVGRAVVGVWRAHTVLDESDEAEGSPEAPDRFRKLRSSSSLNSLRMSLRKRLPLRTVQASSLPEKPTCETLKEQPKTGTVRKLTRSARNSITDVYQVHGFCVLRSPSINCAVLIFYVMWINSSFASSSLSSFSFPEDAED